jgi:hypothetical protein
MRLLENEPDLDLELLSLTEIATRDIAAIRKMEKQPEL